MAVLVRRRCSPQRRPVFVVGCGRSGNTLMRRILVSRGGVFIPPESYAIGPIARAHGRRRLLPWQRYVDLLLADFARQPGYEYFGYDVWKARSHLLQMPNHSLACALETLYSCYESEEGSGRAPYWGDKTPFNTVHLDHVVSTFPGALYIEMLRHAGDVCVSYLEMGRYSRPEPAAHRWVNSIQNVRRARLKGAHVITVRYERLVQDPATAMEAITAELGIPVATGDTTPARAGRGDWSLPHHSRVALPITPTRIGRHQALLSHKERQRVGAIVNEELVRLGYAAL